MSGKANLVLCKLANQNCGKARRSHHPRSFMMSAILVSFVFFPLFFSWNALPTSKRFSCWMSRTRSSTVPSMTKRQTVVGLVCPRR